MSMCGRFSHSTGMAEISDFLKREVRVERARYNIAPRQMAPVVVMTITGPSLLHHRWGLIPSWAKEESVGDKMINARSETVLEKPSFRNAFKLRRCLVIADGWYEWSYVGRTKVPWRICRTRGQGVVCFAGLYETWTPPEIRTASETYGIARQTFTILTTEANQTLSRLHDRMPVVLDRSSWAEWLDPMTRVDKAQALLLPADEADFHAYQVTPKVGRSDFDNPLAHAPLPDLELDLGDAAF
jgi:putative SOS response-associated peptidase YedK